MKKKRLYIIKKNENKLFHQSIKTETEYNNKNYKKYNATVEKQSVSRISSKYGIV